MRSAQKARDPCARGGVGEGREGSAGLAAGGAAELVAVFGGDDPPVAGRDRRGLCEPGVEAALGGLLCLVQVGPDAELVGVEQVLANLGRRLVPRDLAGGELLQCGCAAGTRAAEPGGGTKVADQEPLARQRDLAVPCSREGDLERPASQAGDDSTARRGQSRPSRAVRTRFGRRANVTAQLTQIPRGEAAEALLQRPREQPRCLGDRGVGALTEQQRALGGEEIGADLVRRLPGRASAGRGGE